MNKFIRILRIHHWSKNLFIFLGFLLAFLYVKYVEVYDIFKLLVVFLSFSFISSGNYILNDLLDIKFDSNNPLKKNRMLTKKMIPKKYSIIFMILLWIVGLFIPFIFLEPKKTIFGFIILFSGILYNVKPFRLKSIAILDVLSESINSPIRMYAGWVILTGEYMN
ncbi:UbiA family prenyltransferase, partial [Candidatus Woesearchaeota archaeon]|nr:UbiA family prenyltransferase [Candidatus Woesearchaeota archaeon]